MERVIRALSEAEQSALYDGLEMASKMLNKPRPLSSSDIQWLYDYCLSSEDEFPEGVIAVGLSFGQLFIDAENYEWVRVNDEYGEETCIAPKFLNINCAPISMIQKRLEAQEQVNIAELFADTVKVIQGLIDDGEFEYR